MGVFAKKKLTILIISIFLIVIALVAIASGLFGKKPFKDLNPAEIASASVIISPPNETVQITEIKELVDYLEDIEIYGKDNSYIEYAGQTCTFSITTTDGTVLKITEFNPFIIIDDVGYKCKYEPCEALNHYANSLLTR